MLAASVDSVELVGQAFTRPILRTPDSTRLADLSQPGEGSRLVEEVRPTLVINAAALADVDACERTPRLARALNASLPGELAGACKGIGARFVQVSTDAVHGAEPGPYSPATTPSPLNVYGATKAEGEYSVLSTDPAALIVRTNIVGWSPVGSRSLLEFFVTRLRNAEPTPGFTDVQFRPVAVRSLWPLIRSWVATGQTGIVHATGSTRLSKYEFGRKVAEHFSLDVELVVPSRAADATLSAQRATDLDVVPSATPVGCEPSLLDIDEGLRLLCDDERRGIREKLSSLISATAGG